MAQKVLLFSVNQCSFPYPVFPLGISHLASALDGAGYETRVGDIQVESTGIKETIKEFQPDYIGLSLRNIDNINSLDTDFYAPTLSEVAKKVRAVSCVPLILGGSGFSLFPEELLISAEADFGICGEGEAALLQLLECLGAKKEHEDIPGLVYHKNGGIRVNPKNSCDINRITKVYRSQNLVDYYTQKSGMLNIQTQRGCAYKCCYCTYPLIEGATFRCRSPQVVCDEIADVIASGARYFFIVDSVFNTFHEHVTRICEEILRRQLDIKWGCYLRPRGITQPMMDLMAHAGLSHIEFGTDSFCDSVLDTYGKQFRVEDVIQASECARNASVRYAHFLIIGGPGETEETIREGFKNAGLIKKSVFFPYVGMRLYPGTPLYEIALQEGVVTREKDLFEPYFYVTPHISHDDITRMLKEHGALQKNWIIGEVEPALQQVMVNLRKMGVVGPLWEFLVR